MIPVRCYFDMSDTCVAYESLHHPFTVANQPVLALVDSGVYNLTINDNPLGMSASQLFPYAAKG